ncbi:sel1 repeat family protein [Verrucomicrobiaceae bacterium N1E253]|uniref:Sel1 repeat family protein n=1 Tax=Oceaniferula marina TaxID=2748318 RepID=A0A851GPB9_9BACT|nr:tetratricopeptide repeat protein [Oceaniferula marina]NWK56867.1 sel1 repeat family protein [Oceaniferula marina]
MSKLPDTYFSLFQQQVDACQIADRDEHAQTRRKLNREIRECISALKQVANEEDPEVWYALGHASTFFEKNISQANHWYQKAADAGHTQAITKMGNRLRQSQHPEDQEQSRQWLTQAAKQGDAYAMLCIGFAHRDGKGVSKNLQEAKNWFIKALDAGEPSAPEQLADLLHKHLHDPAQALPYYLKAQQHGVSCHEALAEIYNTRGTTAYNPHKAKDHYEILLRRGQKSAPWVMLELAKLHASGQVSDNGVTHARKWLYQIITQCPKSLSTRKKAERLLEKLDESLF